MLIDRRTQRAGHEERHEPLEQHSNHGHVGLQVGELERSPVRLQRGARLAERRVTHANRHQSDTEHLQVVDSRGLSDA